jgi:P27 family predicted phage terminase small subunit
MGDNPKPIERHLLNEHGRTLGGRELDVQDVSQMQAVEPPPMPEGLRVRGQLEWAALWSEGRWFWPGDYRWVEMIARAYDEVDQYEAEIARVGLLVKGTRGVMIANPLIAEKRRAQEVIRQALSKLGMSPTDRARLRLVEAQGTSVLKGITDGFRGAQPRDDDLTW